MSNRIDKVNSLLEREISKILLHDFTFSPDILVTLTRVEASANLIEAKAYISVLFTSLKPEGGGGPDSKISKVLEILNAEVYSVQHKINRILKMRPVPKIKFVKDENISKAGRIEELLGKLKIDEK